MYIQNSGAEAVKMETTQKNWITKIRISPHKVLTEGVIQAKNRYQQLKHRYGPLYPIVILGVALITYPLPIPGITISSVALIVLIAEVHRAIFQRKRHSGDYCQSGGCGED
jgi:hypothetical protein